MLRVDDLQVGMFVSITGRILPERDDAWVDPTERSIMQTYFGIGASRSVQKDKTHPAEGLPLLVRAIALPFAVVEKLDGGIERIDVRKVELVKLTLEYVAALWTDAYKQKGTKTIRRSELERINGLVPAGVSMKEILENLLDPEFPSFGSMIGRQVHMNIPSQKEEKKPAKDIEVVEDTTATPIEEEDEDGK
jgi:hypothetical protein